MVESAEPVGPDGPTKPELRKRASRAVAAQPPEAREGHDASIAASVVGTRAYADARQVIGYHALADEVSTSVILDRAFLDGKAVFLPVADAVDWGLSFRSFTPGEALVRTPGGVYAPAGGEAPASGPTLLLVPARVFDRHGGRVGRGKGCYDRVLSALPSGTVAVGIAYFVQLVERVPSEPHDRPVDAVITERGRFACSERGRRAMGDSGD